MTDHGFERAAFHAMEDGTAEDWRRILAAAQAFCGAHVDRILEQLGRLGEDDGGFAVGRLEHCLQTATRAHQAGRDEEYVVCALLHDIGDLMCPTNHADMAAAMLKPYVSEENHWMVAKHTIFQGYYYFHHLGVDRNLREQYRGHPHFDYTAEFCQLFDQNSFEPAFESMPLEAFEPMLRRVLAAPKQGRTFRAVEAAA
jgi:predicted HD phosphohydrolase